MFEIDMKIDITENRDRREDWKWDNWSFLRFIELGLENPQVKDIDARYVGLLKFSKSGLRKIEEILNDAYENYGDRPWKQSGKPVRKAYMTDLLQAIIETGCSVKARKFCNGWLEFDTNEDYENACQWAQDGSIKEFINL